MTERERQNLTLDFASVPGRGALTETFYPWDETIELWKKQGLPENIAAGCVAKNAVNDNQTDEYLYCRLADGVYAYEKYLGFDGIKRIMLLPPFSGYERATIQENDRFIIRRDTDGWLRKYDKADNKVINIQSVIETPQDWDKVKEKAFHEVDTHLNDAVIRDRLAPYSERHIGGDYSIRLNISGFFWTPRTLWGVENHLFALYDHPETIQDINRFLLNYYMEKITAVCQVLIPDLLYICEDLSGKNGPMISADHYRLFIGRYYRELIPYVKSLGIKNVFVDTDGDFSELIPSFLADGIDGFLPVDVNAGMDIIRVRSAFPRAKLIGGVNKLTLEQGKAAIDKEVMRVLPIIRQGGYLPGIDHQVTPQTSLENYRYYIERLNSAMSEAGQDAPR